MTSCYSANNLSICMTQFNAFYKENFISLAKGGKTRYNKRQHNGGGRRRRFGGFML